MASQGISPTDGTKLGIDNSIKDGGLNPIPDAAQNPKIIALARWAVDEYNKEQGRAEEFSKVILANTQNVSGGIRYYIQLETFERGIVKVFEAIVLVTSPDFKKLESFNGLR